MLSNEQASRTVGIPPSLQSVLDEETGAGKVLHAIIADLCMDRTYGRTCIAVTADRVVSADERGERVVLRLDEIAAFRVEELFGHSRLIAELGSRPAPGAAPSKEEGKAGAPSRHLACYTLSLVPDFADFCRVLNQVLRGETVALPEGAQPAVCPRCGAPLPERGAVCALCTPSLRIMKRVMGLMAPYRRQMGLLIFLTLLSVLLQLGPPYVTKVFVDVAIPTGRLDVLLRWVGYLVVLGVGYLLVRIASGALSAWLAGRVVADLRSRMHAHVQDLQLNYFNRRESGEVIGRVMNDTNFLQNFLVDGVPFLLVNTLMFFGIGVMLLWLNAQLALLVFLPVPFLLAGGRAFFHRIHPLGHRWGTIQERMHTALNESVQGIKTIKAFSLQNLRSGVFRRHTEASFETLTRIEQTFVFFRDGMFWIMSLGIAAVWYFGARQITGGDGLTLGTLMAFVGYIWLFYGPLQWFSVVLNWMTRAMAAAERVFALLDSKPELYTPANVRTIDRVTGEIAFEDVRFSYERGKEIIKGVSFAIRPGEMIGLVGKSGVGKSTLINLVCRFWDVDSGRILIQGTDIRELDLNLYRRQIGIVMQESFLFNASILENIRFGFPDASFEDVVRAARAAHAHEFILGKEDGYDTIIGEKGAELSGGEKQRLAIARAILHDPPILILDEATSSVDLETEKKIQAAIVQLIRGRTTIAIAHRLSTLRNASRLIVMEDGRVAEIGTHDELLAKPDGIYSKLVKIQSEVNALRQEQMVWKE